MIDFCPPGGTFIEAKDIVTVTSVGGLLLEVMGSTPICYEHPTVLRVAPIISNIQPQMSTEVEKVLLSGDSKRLAELLIAV